MVNNDKGKKNVRDLDKHLPDLFLLLGCSVKTMVSSPIDNNVAVIHPEASET